MGEIQVDGTKCPERRCREGSTERCYGDKQLLRGGWYNGGGNLLRSRRTVDTDGVERARIRFLNDSDRA